MKEETGQKTLKKEVTFDAQTTEPMAERRGDKYVIDYNQYLDLEGAPRLYRIRALKGIPVFGVEAGNYGGWVEGPESLSQEGTCWIKDCAMVYDGATVKGFALVSGYAKVMGKSSVDGHSIINGFAIVSHSFVKGKTKISDQAVVEFSTLDDFVKVQGQARVMNSTLGKGTEVDGKSEVKDSQLFGCIICGNSTITMSIIERDCRINDSDVEYSTLKEGVAVFGSSSITSSDLTGSIRVLDNAVIHSSRIVGDHIVIADGAEIRNDNFIMIGPVSKLPCVMLYRARCGINGTAGGEVLPSPYGLAVYLAQETGYKLGKLKKLLNKLGDYI